MKASLRRCFFDGEKHGAERVTHRETGAFAILREENAV